MVATAYPVQDTAPEDLGAPALRTFFNIAERWELGAEQQMTLLGINSPSTYFKWRKQQPARVSPDMLERLSYLLGIYKDLQILLPDRALADSWLDRPNSNLLFGGEPPLSRMLSGHVADLYVVRQYLDAERGGWQ